MVQVRDPVSADTEALAAGASCISTGERLLTWTDTASAIVFESVGDTVSADAAAIWGYTFYQDNTKCRLTLVLQRNRFQIMHKRWEDNPSVLNGHHTQLCCAFQYRCTSEVLPLNLHKPYPYTNGLLFVHVPLFSCHGNVKLVVDDWLVFLQTAQTQYCTFMNNGKTYDMKLTLANSC